jgi:hypothetical protein
MSIKLIIEENVDNSCNAVLRFTKLETLLKNYAKRKKVTFGESQPCIITRTVQFCFGNLGPLKNFGGAGVCNGLNSLNSCFSPCFKRSF